MHFSVRLLSNKSLMSIDERGNQLIYAPLNNPPDGFTAFYAQPINTRATLQGLDVSNGTPNTVVQSHPDGTTIRYSRYGANDFLPAVLTDRNGNVITYERDPAGKLLVARDVHNRSVTFAYNAAEKIESTTDSAGRTTSFIYDGAGNRITDTDVNGDVTQYQYNGLHQITQITHPNGGKSFYTYKPNDGRVLTMSEDGDVNKVTYSYDDANQKTTVTDALNHITVFDWIHNSGMKRIAKVQDQQNGITSLTYDADMRVTSYTDPLGRTVSLRHDPSGNQVAAVDPLNQVTQAAYNARFNSVASVTDPKGNKRSFFYDAKGNLVQVKDAASNFTTVSYDKHGHPIAVKDALGNLMTATYNSNGALISVTNPLGLTAHMARDNLNRITRYTDPSNAQTNFTYDADGHPTQVKDALNGITAFDYQAGRGGRQLHTVADANNHVTNFSYDINGRPTSVSNALGQSASISYDAKSRPTSVTTRNGQALSFTYDNLDRLTQLSVPEGNIGMTYDAVGRLLTANGYNSSALATTYDARDRVTQVIQTLPNGHSSTIGYTFDANGNRTGMTTSWGNYSYTYNSLDRVTSITNPQGQIITFSYDAIGRRTQMVYPNGIRTRYVYDAAGQITQILHEKAANQTAVAFTNYTYDVSGNRIGIADASGNHTFTYDVLNRLTGAGHSGMSSLPVKSEIFSYDASGNRTADAARTGYAYNDANRIVSDSSFSYTSDASGNMTSRTDQGSGQTTTFAYDSANRLVQVSASTYTIATYKYDMAGRRIEKNVGGTITRYVYDGQDILAMIDGGNNLIALFTHGPGIDSPLIMRRSGQDYYFHADALGSVNALTDGIGNILETYEYQAFGQTMVKDTQGAYNQSMVGNTFQYTSRELDSESGLYFYRARYYDTGTGRFLQEDPIGFTSGDINLYRYGFDNPLTYVDPLGLAGAGFQFGAGAEAGLGRGKGGQISTSVGCFSNGTCGSVGTSGTLNPRNGHVIGASAGGGMSIFGTNASSTRELLGPFKTANFNAGLPFEPWIQASGQISWGYDENGKFIVYVAVSLPLMGTTAGLSGSLYETITEPIPSEKSNQEDGDCP